MRKGIPSYPFSLVILLISGLGIVFNGVWIRTPTIHMKSPNVHVVTHYGIIADEYSLLSLVNILIGEDKHRYVLDLQTWAILSPPIELAPMFSAEISCRWYKRLIHRTNHIQWSMSRANFWSTKTSNWQSDYFLQRLLNTPVTNPELTSACIELYQNRLNIFQQILPKSEIADYSNQLKEDESALALPTDTT